MLKISKLIAYPPRCLKYRQFLCYYPNKQELTSLLSFLSHSLVSQATMLDELRGGLTPSREPILSHPKFVSLRGHVTPVPMTTRLEGSLDISLIKETYQTCQQATLKSRRECRHAMGLYAPAISSYHIIFENPWFVLAEDQQKSSYI